MSNYRGLIWSLVALAGTATAATFAYRYVTRNTHVHGDDSDGAGDASTTSGSRRRARTNGQEPPRTQFVDDDGDGDDAYESLSESEYDDAFSLDEGGDDNAVEMQQSQQQMVLVAREGNLLLSVFGVVLMLLVGAVSLIMTWTSEEMASPADLPMFAPLMWIAIGIFTAASVEVLSQSALTTPEIPVIEEKAVFPHDESDFEMIRQHNDESLTEPPSPVKSQSSSGDSDRASSSVAPSSSSLAAASSGPKAEISSELSAIVKRADDLTEKNQHSEAREYLLSELPDYPEEVEVLWRLARAAYSLSEEKSDQEEKKAFVFEGLTFAEKAYASDAASAASNLWMAIMNSSVGNYRDLKDKIAGAYVIRDHTERSIELNPSDPTPYHILGNWALAFADMSWIEKRAAAALFGTPPTATYEDAVKHLHAAENLNPGGWKKNAYLLAETYNKMKKPSEARKWLLVAKDAPLKTKDDQDAQQLVLALMKKLKLKLPACRLSALLDPPPHEDNRLMTMPPREALMPLLKLAGTAAIMAAAYSFGSKAVVAAAYKQHGRPGAHTSTATANKKTKRDAELSDKKKKSEETATAVAADAAPASEQTTVVAPPAKMMPRSSLAVAVLLQDPFMLLSVFGVLVMVLAVLVSVAVVALNDQVASVEELPMFVPLMCVGMALIALGMLSSMMRSLPKKRSPASEPTVARCPFSGAVATLPPKKTKATTEGESEEDEEDEASEKRVSRCPFGFG